MKRIESTQLTCPEGHGEADVIVTFLIHEQSRSGIGEKIDQISPVKHECSIQDILLRKGENCTWACQYTEEYKSFIQEIIKDIVA